VNPLAQKFMVASAVSRGTCLQFLRPASSGRRFIGMGVSLIAINLLIVLGILSLVANQPTFATALLAYGLGLKHAFDADHIAAIDNVTRKLIGERRQTHFTGLFFSLGHSTVVLLATVAIVFAGHAVSAYVAIAQSAGAVIGTLVSGFFLALFAGINAAALWRAVAVPEGTEHGRRRKILVRFYLPLLSVVTKSWQMYPVGFLFGLGFDTATEIALLALAAAASRAGWFALIFPALFAAGMSMIDTADGFLMARAYAWTARDPKRLRHYNFAITLVSILAALGIGATELTTLFTGVDPLSHISGWMGGGLCGLFAAVWLVAAQWHRPAASRG
jgi:high-affinity nickel-transport protein